MKVITYTDGGARGNPGPASLGVVIKDEQGKILAGYGEYIGETTNNVAEYSAVISALERAHHLGATEVECRMDSKLVAEQMSGRWRVKEPHLQTLFMKAYKAKQLFKKVSFHHVYREQNKEADAYVNQALDERMKN
jgi:ribonuclease HI